MIMHRFELLEEVVLDRQTGLVWTKNASLSEFPLSWDEALIFVRDLNRSGLYGHGDWRLPNRRELNSLISREAVNPSLPHGHPFVDIFNGYYWTSTTCARLPGQAWYVHLGGARVFKGMKYNSYMVWPVRTGNHGARVFQTGQWQCYDGKGDIIDCRKSGQDGEFQSGVASKPRFTSSADVVFDHSTNLTWLRNANVGTTVLDWNSALNFVEKLNGESTFGHDDWRLPDIAELESLTDMSRHTPALPQDCPFIQVQEFYWSSTTSRYEEQYAWVLYLMDGAVGVGYKPLAEFYLWPVRG